MESIFIDLSVPASSISVIVGVVYRPPSGDIPIFNDQLYNILSSISSDGKHCFLMGDFNIDINKAASNSFLHNLSSCGFHPTINKPTRVTSNSTSIIDNIFTNVNNISDSVEVRVPGILLTDISDHFPIFINSSIRTIKTHIPPLYTRIYSKNNCQLFSSRILNAHWNDVYQHHDTKFRF